MQSDYIRKYFAGKHWAFPMQHSIWAQLGPIWECCFGSGKFGLWVLLIYFVQNHHLLQKLRNEMGAFDIFCTKSSFVTKRSSQPTIWLYFWRLAGQKTNFFFRVAPFFRVSSLCSVGLPIHHTFYSKTFFFFLETCV